MPQTLSSYAVEVDDDMVSRASTPTHLGFKPPGQEIASQLLRYEGSVLYNSLEELKKVLMLAVPVTASEVGTDL